MLFFFGRIETKLKNDREEKEINPKTKLYLTLNFKLYIYIVTKLITTQSKGKNEQVGPNEGFPFPLVWEMKLNRFVTAELKQSVTKGLFLFPHIPIIYYYH